MRGASAASGWPSCCCVSVARARCVVVGGGACRGPSMRGSCHGCHRFMATMLLCGSVTIWQRDHVVMHGCNMAYEVFRALDVAHRYVLRQRMRSTLAVLQQYAV